MTPSTSPYTGAIACVGGALRDRLVEELCR